MYKIDQLLDYIKHTDVFDKEQIKERLSVNSGALRTLLHYLEKRVLIKKVETEKMYELTEEGEKRVILYKGTLQEM